MDIAGTVRGRGPAHVQCRRAGVPARVTGGARRLRQVLVNLVGNAIKSTQRGEALVQVETPELSNEPVILHFRVKDSGIGIPKEKQSMIFEAFIRADSSTTRNYGGTGLGLVTRMQGRLWVESEWGQGSTFHFTVTMRLAPQESALSIRDHHREDAV